jgi:hypothetical protein
METLRLSKDELPIALWLSARTGVTVDEDALLFDEAMGRELTNLLEYYAIIASDDHDLQPWSSEVALGLRERVISQEPVLASKSTMRGELSGPSREPTWFSGERFEAPVSMNRMFVDIMDRKNVGRLTLLDASALHELKDLVQELLEFMDPHSL